MYGYLRLLDTHKNWKKVTPLVSFFSSEGKNVIIQAQIQVLSAHHLQSYTYRERIFTEENGIGF